MQYSIKNKRVLVTGATGFLGVSLCKWLRDQGAHTVGLSSKDCDLRDITQTMKKWVEIKPEIVFHCAVQGGGIGWMKDHPVDSGLDNYRINLNALDASFKTGVRSKWRMHIVSQWYPTDGAFAGLAFISASYRHEPKIRRM